MEQLIYCKYSKERSPKFAIRTDIIQEDVSFKARKSAIYPEGIAHVQSMEKKYEVLKEYYEQSGMAPCFCNINGKYAEFQYIGGETLQEKIERLLQADKLEEAEQLIDLYLEKCFWAQKKISFYVTDDIVEVFGDSARKLQGESLVVSNIDLICSNIIVNENGWNIIDYEWTYSFPVPLKFIVFRSLFLLHHQVKHTPITELDYLMNKAEISENERTVFQQMENDFQSFVRGDRLSAFEIQQKSGKKALTIGQLELQSRELQGEMTKKEREVLLLQHQQYILNKNDMEKMISIKNLFIASKKRNKTDEIIYNIDVIRIDEFRMTVAGWGCAKTKDGVFPLEYEILSQQNEAEETIIGRVHRKDVCQVVEGQDSEKDYGFHIQFVVNNFELDDMCYLAMRYQGIYDEYVIDLRLMREKVMRKYPTREAMLADNDEKRASDEIYYKKHLGRKAYKEIISRRLDGTDVSYYAWRKQLNLSEDVRASQKEHHFSYEPTISIVVPAYRTPHDFLIQMIESVRSQTYGKWELCIADASLNDSIKDVLEEYHQKDNRVKYVLLEDNEGISGNTNKAIEIATGDFIALLDHDDLLSEDALFEVVKCINEQNVDVLYSDEDKVTFDLKYHFEPYFKPDYNKDLLLSCNYICHFFVVKKNIVDRVGWLDSTYDGSQDYDFILRCTNAVDKVGHIPRVIYHWRCHPNSTAMNPESKLYCYDAGKNAAQAELNREGISAKVSRMQQYGFYKTEYNLVGNPTVTALILNGDKLESQYEKLEIVAIDNVLPENVYEKLADALGHATGEYFFIAQGNGTVLENDLEGLLANAQRNGVGAVGCRVISMDEKVLDAGRVTALSDKNQAVYRGLSAMEPGYNMQSLVQREVSALGLNGLLIEKNLLENLIQELLKSGGKSISQLVRKRDMKLVYSPYTVLKCDEPFDIIMEKYIDLYEEKEYDPAYNISFNANGEAYKLGW